MRIREAEPADPVAHVVTTAFGDDGPLVARVLEALGTTGALRASLVASDDAEPGAPVVGHVALSRGWVDARDRLVEVLVLSPLSVRPDRQRSGIGTALLTAALEEAERQGAPAVFLEGDWTYYGRRGWEAAEPLGFARPSERIPGPAFQVALLPSYDGTTGRLVYPEAFWAHDAVGLRDPWLRELEESAD